MRARLLCSVTKHEVFVKFSELMKYKVVSTEDAGGVARHDMQMVLKIRRFFRRDSYKQTNKQTRTR